MHQEVQERVAMARRCAWCLRFCIDGTWIPGRRADDDVMLAATTHTICEECVEKLRREGLSL